MGAPLCSFNNRLETPPKGKSVLPAPAQLQETGEDKREERFREKAGKESDAQTGGAGAGDGEGAGITGGQTEAS